MCVILGYPEIFPDPLDKPTFSLYNRDMLTGKTYVIVEAFPKKVESEALWKTFTCLRDGVSYS